MGKSLIEVLGLNLILKDGWDLDKQRGGRRALLTVVRVGVVTGHYEQSTEIGSTPGMGWVQHSCGKWMRKAGKEKLFFQME